MHGIIEVTDALGLSYHYVTIKMEKDTLQLTYPQILFTAKVQNICLNQLENLHFSTKYGRKTISFYFQDNHYTLIDNASLSVLQVAEFIHAASFAYFHNYISLPEVFQLNK